MITDDHINVIKKLILKANLKPNVGFHGQTIYHNSIKNFYTSR